MSGELVFMMGKFEATFPTDRHYSDNHLWLKQHGEVYRVGLTAYSVRLLQDVYFLDWTVDSGVEVRRKQEIGEVESSKALSSLYAPVDGLLVEFNEELLDDPSAINTDNYETGWLYSLKTESPMLGPEEYLKELDTGWEVAQRFEIRLVVGQLGSGWKLTAEEQVCDLFKRAVRSQVGNVVATVSQTGACLSNGA